jgi:hypothetical protein
MFKLVRFVQRLKDRSPILVTPLGSIIPARFARPLKASSSILVRVLPERSRLTNLVLLALKIATTLPEVEAASSRLFTFNLTVYAAAAVLPDKPDRYVSKSVILVKVAAVIGRVLVCDVLYVQVSVSVPAFTVVGGVVIVQLLPQLCAFGSMGMGKKDV